MDEDASSGGHLHFVLTVPADAVEVAADRLWQSGARAVEERPLSAVGGRVGSEGPGGSTHSRAPVGADAAAGAVELWTVLGDEPERMVGEELQLEADWRWRTVPVVAAGAELWRDHVEPIDVAGRLTIVPAWRVAPPQPADRLAVSIEPGGAFGLGDHPTTRLSVVALLDAFDAHDVDAHDVGAPNGDAASSAATRRAPPSVLDVGCGTGVLAIIAARLGASPVRAIDIAPAAIAATIDNARRNGVADSIVADRSPCRDVLGNFDIVVANILAPTLIAIAGDLRRLTALDGRLVVSGVLGDRHEHVVAALDPMIVEGVVHRDGWAAITLRHR